MCDGAEHGALLGAAGVRLHHPVHVQREPAVWREQDVLEDGLHAAPRQRDITQRELFAEDLDVEGMAAEQLEQECRCVVELEGAHRYDAEVSEERRPPIAQERPERRDL